MLLDQLKQEAFKLPPRQRLELIKAIIDSLQDTSISKYEKSNAIQRMRGFLKTNQPTPTDEEVKAMLEERRVNKYLS